MTEYGLSISAWVSRPQPFPLHLSVIPGLDPGIQAVAVTGEIPGLRFASPGMTELSVVPTSAWAFRSQPFALHLRHPGLDPGSTSAGRATQIPGLRSAPPGMTDYRVPISVWACRSQPFPLHLSVIRGLTRDLHLRRAPRSRVCASLPPGMTEFGPPNLGRIPPPISFNRLGFWRVSLAFRPVSAISRAFEPPGRKGCRGGSFRS